ncbi:CHAT domain-containing protein [Paraliomyxa miuraensis]|uniref:CHAT domain-containing protein n=1 Tax=Paraliomyxa miuraensis TaxID=376150 RepID=UPI00224E1ADC|nr:CHAT domain-containing protein [Paraliomyxa miuraensis]MCX4240542.1 CHAT domain-containing protein [Paraliomyxa miuraensis]
MSYSLGLGRRSQRKPSGRAVVIVGDDDGNGVPGLAAEEGAFVHEVLARAGWSVGGSWRPWHTAPPPTLLHYAGHGYRSGELGEDSYLALSRYERLSAVEVTSHHDAPTVVVLGACESGVTSNAVIDGGMNMAAAFILAGAELVIAPALAAVDGERAYALSRALYRAAPNLEEPARDLLRALHELQARDEEFTAWRAWRP